MKNLQVRSQVCLGNEILGTLYFPQLGCQSTSGCASEWILVEQSAKLKGGATVIGEKD